MPERTKRARDCVASKRIRLARGSRTSVKHGDRYRRSLALNDEGAGRSCVRDLEIILAASLFTSLSLRFPLLSNTVAACGERISCSIRKRGDTQRRREFALTRSRTNLRPFAFFSFILFVIPVLRLSPVFVRPFEHSAAHSIRNRGDTQTRREIARTRSPTSSAVCRLRPFPSSSSSFRLFVVPYFPLSRSQPVSRGSVSIRLVCAGDGNGNGRWAIAKPCLFVAFFWLRVYVLWFFA